MGIGGVTSTNSMAGIQMTMAGSTDPKIKNIQNEITGTQQKIQALSSKEEVSVDEKANERKKLQKEISGLNAELKQQQEELRKSQKREMMMAELREDQKPAKEKKSADKAQTDQTAQDKTEKKNLNADRQQAGRQGTVITQNSDGTVLLKGKANQNANHGVDTGRSRTAETSNRANEKNLPTAASGETKEKANAKEETKDTNKDTDTGLSTKKVHALVSADVSVQQADRQGTVILKTRDGIVTLKGEINQDERYGTDTERKQTELEKMEKKEQRAMTFQSSVLGRAHHTLRSAAKTNVSKTQNSTQANTEHNAFIEAMKVSKREEQAEQQKFYISFGH